MTGIVNIWQLHMLDLAVFMPDALSDTAPKGSVSPAGNKSGIFCLLDKKLNICQKDKCDVFL